MLLYNNNFVTINYVYSTEIMVESAIRTFAFHCNQKKIG